MNTHTMRPSRVLNKLRNGEVASCFKLNLADARAVEIAALAHGKFAGTVGSAANLDELIGLGYRFLSVGADVIGLSQYCKSIMAEFTNRPAGESKSIYWGKAS